MYIPYLCYGKKHANLETVCPNHMLAPKYYMFVKHYANIHMLAPVQAPNKVSMPKIAKVHNSVKILQKLSKSESGNSNLIQNQHNKYQDSNNFLDILLTRFQSDFRKALSLYQNLWNSLQRLSDTLHLIPNLFTKYQESSSDTLRDI